MAPVQVMLRWNDAFGCRLRSSLDDLAESSHEESRTPGIGRSAPYGQPRRQYLDHNLGGTFWRMVWPGMASTADGPYE